MDEQESGRLPRRTEIDLLWMYRFRCYKCRATPATTVLIMTAHMPACPLCLGWPKEPCYVDRVWQLEEYIKYKKGLYNIEKASLQLKIYDENKKIERLQKTEEIL